MKRGGIQYWIVNTQGSHRGYTTYRTLAEAQCDLKPLDKRQWRIVKVEWL